MEHIFTVRNTEKMRNFEVIFDKFNVIVIFYSGNYKQKRNIELYNYYPVVTVSLSIQTEALEGM
jgi:hypothetical protein